MKFKTPPPGSIETNARNVSFRVQYLTYKEPFSEVPSSSHLFFRYALLPYITLIAEGLPKQPLSCLSHSKNALISPLSLV